MTFSLQVSSSAFCTLLTCKQKVIFFILMKDALCLHCIHLSYSV